MREIAALATLLAAAACAAPDAGLPSPVLLQFEPPERGGPSALPEANPSGVLDLSGPCVALETSPGQRSIIISTAEASVGRDLKGLYLQYRKRRFRHGTWVEGGGGSYDRIPRFGSLQRPVPAACTAGSYLIFYGIEPAVRSNSPPNAPPPPGPVLLRYRPETAGGPDVFRAAILTGKLDFSGSCARLTGPGGIARVMVTSAGSRLGFDEQGVFLASGADKLRNGDQVQAGGGEIGGRPNPSEIDGPIPSDCEAGPFVEAIGIRRYRPRGGPPDSPPRPPSDFGLGTDS